MTLRPHASLLLALAVLLVGPLLEAGCTDPAPDGPCVGPTADAVATSAADAAASDDSGDAPCVTCPGAPQPMVAAMRDFQPNSCRYGDSYSLDAFKGRTTVVALLAAW